MRVVTRKSDNAQVAEHRTIEADGKTFVLWTPYLGGNRDPRMSRLQMTELNAFAAAHDNYRLLPCGHPGDGNKWSGQRCAQCMRENAVPECREGYSHSWAMGGGEGLYGVKCRTCGLLAMREHNGHVYRWRKRKTDDWQERRSRP